MGAWGHGNWENDDAMDLVQDLSKPNVLRESLLAASTPSGREETGTCCRALAAAEVVAALVGEPSSHLPDEVSAWVAEHRTAESTELVALAQAAVAAVEGESELQELFDEDGRDDGWHAVVGDLRRRLSVSR